MVINKDVIGHETVKQGVEVGITTVYVRSNFRPCILEGNEISNLRLYDEVQYTKDEYIELISKEKEGLEKELTDNQLAIAELFEMITTLGG